MLFCLSSSYHECTSPAVSNFYLVWISFIWCTGNRFVMLCVQFILQTITTIHELCHCLNKTRSKVQKCYNLILLFAIKLINLAPISSFSSIAHFFACCCKRCFGGFVYFVCFHCQHVWNLQFSVVFLFLLSFCLLDHIIVAFPLVYYDFLKFVWRVAWDE